jgi:uncharacterized protein YkwD
MQKILLIFSIWLAALHCVGQDTHATIEHSWAKPLRLGDMSQFQTASKVDASLCFERLVAYYFHEEINKYRLEKKLNTIYWDERLWLAARNHNLYQYINGLTHVQKESKYFFTGENPWDRIQYVMYNGFKYSWYTENVLCYTGEFAGNDVESARAIALKSLNMWKSSPGHNQNMLNPKLLAGGTSFLVFPDIVYATSNFSASSDFYLQEIAIDWDVELARKNLPRFTHKGTKCLPYVWTIDKSGSEIKQVFRYWLDRAVTTESIDLTDVASTGFDIDSLYSSTKAGIKESRERYKNALREKSDLKLKVKKLVEKRFSFEFTEAQLTGKQALSVVSRDAARGLPSPGQVKQWGCACRLVKTNGGCYSCIINVVWLQ